MTGTLNRYRFPILVATSLVALLAIMAISASPAQSNIKRLIAPPKACPGQNLAHAPVGVQEKAMRCLIKEVRVRSGLRPVGRSLKLDRAAGFKSRDIQRCNSFDHNACGRDFTYWFKRTGFAKGCWSAAENIAWGAGKNTGARQILAAWLRSPGHRANILDPSHHWQGVGLRKSTFEGYAGAQIWTSHFGRRC